MTEKFGYFEIKCTKRNKTCYGLIVNNCITHAVGPKSSVTETRTGKNMEKKHRLQEK